MSDSLDREFAAMSGNATRKVGDVGERTRLARELFLFGNGDGKPVRNINRLAEKSGASPRTLEKHVARWRKESEEMARGTEAGNGSLVESVTGGMVQLQQELAADLESHLQKLRVTLKILTPGTKAHADTLKLFNLTLSKWEESSGVKAMKECQAALLKEQLKLRAKLEAKGPQTPVERQVTAFSFNTASADKEKD